MFFTILSNVAIMLLYMFLGYVMCKSGKGIVAHAKSMSALLIYILSPAMIVNSFINMDYSKDNLMRMILYFCLSIIIQMLFFMVLYAIFHKKYEDAKYRILSVGGVLGNVGFIGMPIVSSIFPNEPIVRCYSSINVIAMNLIVFTIGVYLITNDKKYISLKSAILNPSTLSLIAAVPIYLLQIKFPMMINDSIGLFAKMVTPMCMIILGMRLSEADFKILFMRPFAYLSSLFKLIIFPLFALLCVKWLPFDDSILKMTIVVLASTPAGVIIESLAELHECEQELAANVVLLTTILSVITVPLVTSFIIM